YVQYAHARASSILRKAQEESVFNGIEDEKLLKNYLKLEEEIALIRMMGDFPSLVEEMAKSLEPHRLTYYLQDLAAMFHRYFNLGTKNPELRVITEDASVSRARLFLVKAIRTVVANGLSLLAITAPEQM
ncbi:MAG: arginine--tRNA ligase, partial [Deltaproteobacteria bacterium CG_4_9_14_3_um_filter_51_14]